MQKMEQVEWEDVQGLLSDGLLALPYAPPIEGEACRQQPHLSCWSRRYEAGLFAKKSIR
jgi:hypothetical protein